MSSTTKSPFLPRLLRSLLLVMLVGLLPLFYLWNQNVLQIQSIVVLTPFLVTLAFILMVFGVWLLITRSFEKAALLSCVAFMLFFTFGHLYNLVEGKKLFSISLGYAKLLLVYLVVFATLIFLVFRIRSIPRRLFLYLNTLVGIVVLFNLVPILIHALKTASPAPRSPASPPVTAPAQAKQRDIYYIVLDAYSRADVLKSLLNYDNTPFINALKARGFYVPDCAFSNFDGTDLTISSVMNYDLLQELKNPTADIGKGITDDPMAIINSKVRAYFKQVGYQFVSGRGYLPENNITNSDIYLNYFQDNKGRDDLSQKRFSALYLNTTLLRVLTELYNQNPTKYSRLPFWFDFNLQANQQLEEATFWYYQNNYMFDSLEKIPEKPGAYLVYAHINAPHGPYVYQSDGSFQYPLGNPLPPDVEKTLYAHEITYLDKRILEVVDAILKTSNPQPVIILQADHGMHNFTSGLDIHKILSAYYLPGDLNTPPYPTITPVNNFRLIIKNYFDPAMPLSPDILYVKYTNDYVSVPSSCDLKP